MALNSLARASCRRARQLKPTMTTPMLMLPAREGRRQGQSDALQQRPLRRDLGYKRPLRALQRG